MSIDVLHDDDGRIDDYSEIDRTQGKQIGWRAAQIKQDESAEHRKRYVYGGYDRGPQIAEEKNQNQEHQHHAQQQVLENSLKRRINKAGPIVVRYDLVASG